MVFKWNHRPKAKNKTTQNKFATPKLGEGNELGPASLVLLCQPFTKTNNEPEHQQTKTQKTKNTLTHTQNKKHEMIGPNSPLEVYNLSD